MPLAGHLTLAQLGVAGVVVLRLCFDKSGFVYLKTITVGGDVDVPEVNYSEAISQKFIKW